MKRSVIIFAGLALLLVGGALLLAGCALLATDDHPARQAPQAMQAKLREHVEALCTLPRYGDSLTNAQKYIIQRLEKAGWEVSLQEFNTAEGETFQNICAVRQGKRPQRYLLGAHYDACDTGEGINPGADDNASGVAALLAVAEYLPDSQPEYTIELVAWACEEPPWFGTDDMGSARHAARYRRGEIRGMVSLEMLGYYSEEPGSQPALFVGYEWILPTVGNFVAVVGDWDALGLGSALYQALRKQLPAVRLNVPLAHDTSLYFSDHRNYHSRGIPSVMVTDTAMLRNPHYHQPTDTPETLDYNRLALVARGIAAAVRQLAWAPET